MMASMEVEGELEALHEHRGTVRGPQFSPPLYRQRYDAVLSVCRRLHAAKVVDVGCAECKLLQLLIREEGVCQLVGLDIDAALLEAHMPRLKPLTSDYVLPRKQPLTIHLMQGSIAEADQRLVDFDLLSCVEVIEHLDPPVLDKVPAAIFGKLQPKVVVMTTPNAEFNVLFPGFHGFRHPDHRFEWTRDQFQTWCGGVCAQFPQYSVVFGGVGQPPPEASHVGYCSQMATFTRTGVYHNVGNSGTPYKSVMECVYPYRQPLPVQQRLRHEAEYRLLQLLRWREGEDDPVRIRLEELLQFEQIRALCSNTEGIREALRDSVVVKCVDGEEAVFSRTDSDDDDDGDGDYSCVCSGLECGLGECEPEDWD